MHYYIRFPQPSLFCTYFDATLKMRFHENVVTYKNLLTADSANKSLKITFKPQNTSFPLILKHQQK